MKFILKDIDFTAEGIVFEIEQAPIVVVPDLPPPDPEPEPPPPEPDPVEPDPEPKPPVDPPKPAPTVPEGSTFDYLSRFTGQEFTHYIESLCHETDPEWYGIHKRGGGTVAVHPTASYDADAKAMCLTLPQYGTKLGTGVDCFWPALTPVEGETVVVKYMTMMSEEIILDVKGKYKYVNLLVDGNDIGIEFRTHQTKDKQGKPIVRFDLRSYLGGAESYDGRTEGIAGPSAEYLYDKHPGPDSSWPYKGEPTEPPGQYVIYPNKWYVLTCEVTSLNGRVAVRYWIEDGVNPPCCWIASPTDPSRGFLLGAQTPPITGIYFELDQSSGAESFIEPQRPRRVWFKDVAVLKNVKGEATLGKV